ncbi:MAG: S-layer homology domain-containing protein [Defluviitaleaceae bacterium]|nr:S-layer homology domain-containing protein [Defluviitaleaceae bacterium]
MFNGKTFLKKFMAVAAVVALVAGFLPATVFANANVSTSQATDVTPNGATISASWNLTNNDINMAELGIIFSTHRNDVINGQGQSFVHTNIPAGSPSTQRSGNFTVTLTNLAPNTEYFARAYVSTRAGIALAQSERQLAPGYIRFTTSQHGAGTGSQTGVHTNTATFANAVISARGSFPTGQFVNVSERGFVVSSSTSSPTTQSGTRRHTQSSLETSANNIAADWQVTSSASVYYVRAYIINNGQPVYGNVIRVEIGTETPLVFTRSAEMTSGTEARVVIDVAQSGRSAVFERGVVFSTTVQQPQLGTGNVLSRSVAGTVGETEVILTGLTPNTRYFVRAYARNEQGIAYGQVIELTTIGTDTIRTSAATNIAQDRFTANGNITGITASDIREKGFVFSSTNNTPTLSDQRVSMSSISTGDFSMEITGRARETRYFVRAFMTLESGTVFGQTVEVTTAAQDVTVAITFQSMDGLQTVGTQNISVSQGATITASQLNIPEGFSLQNPNWYVQITNQTAVNVLVQADQRPEAAFISGTGNFTFSPNRDSTRGEVAQILYNLSTDRLINNPMTFSDVAANHPNRRAIDYVSSKLHMRGDAGATTFRPNDPITRAEIGVVLMNFYSLTGTAVSNFPDVAQGAWYHRPVSLAFSNQMVAGYEDGTFRPHNNITRAEITTMFVRAERRSLQPLGTTQFVDVPASHWAHQFIMNASVPH